MRPIPLFLLTFYASAALLFSQDATVPSSPPLEEPPSVPADPTVADSALQQVLGNDGKSVSAQLPPLILRGKLLVADRPGVVLFELDKNIYALTEGVTLTLTGQYSGATLCLVELTRNSVVLETKPLNKTLRLQ